MGALCIEPCPYELAGLLVALISCLYWIRTHNEVAAAMDSGLKWVGTQTCVVAVICVCTGHFISLVSGYTMGLSFSGIIDQSDSSF